MRIKHIIKITKKVIGIFKYSKMKIVWYRQYKFLGKSKLSANQIAFENQDRVLIIIPHADDELIGCYELMKNFKSNIELFYCGFTGTRIDKENYDIRLEEFKQVCKQLGVTYTLAEGNTLECLRSKILEYNPKYIFVPSFIDWHEEHIKVNTMLLEILDENYNVGLYQISVPIPLEMVNYYTSLDKVGSRQKWKNFKKIYISQKHMPYQRFRYNEMINRIDIKNYSSEVFGIFTYEEWRIMLKRFTDEISDQEISELKLEINDLIKIRKKASKIYNKIK